MIELERHIEILLLSNDCVIVPGFGGFMAHHVDARYDGRNSMFLPPMRTIGFNPQLQMNDSLLVLSYVEAYDISYPEALRRIEDEVMEVRQTLENTGKYEFRGIGSIILNEDGNYEFEPCEAGILTPDLYGLGGLDVLPLAEIATEKEEEEKEETPQETPVVNANTVFTTHDDDEEDGTGEFISIRKSWIRNIAAACIALIAFFTFSTPLGNPTVQKSQIDTGMLTRILPKETHKAPRELMLNGQEAEMMGATEQVGAAEEVRSIEAPTSETMLQEVEPKAPVSTYYCIVLASRVTKRNAANYAEHLQAKGFKDTRVLISDTNVKVIYGNFEDEAKAYSELNRLRNNEAFEDGWVTKVKE